MRLTVLLPARLTSSSSSASVTATPAATEGKNDGLWMVKSSVSSASSDSGEAALSVTATMRQPDALAACATCSASRE